LISLTGSFAYLGGSMGGLAADSGNGATGRQLHNIAPLEPLPPGSINAVLPLPSPKRTDQGKQGAFLPVSVTETAPAHSAEASENHRYATVAISSLNVRASPSSRSQVIGSVRAGTRLTIVGEERGWMQVSGDGRQGWVYGRYLQALD
jgi:hypothetical protein